MDAFLTGTGLLWRPTRHDSESLVHAIRQRVDQSMPRVGNGPRVDTNESVVISGGFLADTKRSLMSIYRVRRARVLLKLLDKKDSLEYPPVHQQINRA